MTRKIFLTFPYNYIKQILLQGFFVFGKFDINEILKFVRRFQTFEGNKKNIYVQYQFIWLIKIKYLVQKK